MTEHDWIQLSIRHTNVSIPDLWIVQCTILHTQAIVLLQNQPLPEGLTIDDSLVLLAPFCSLVPVAGVEHEPEDHCQYDGDSDVDTSHRRKQPDGILLRANSE